ncbi:MAG: glutathione S-transferase family protein [Ramlibacter sp.]|nr:glutathione S-transferase family protein [Ramlibacter sp.]
MDLPPLTLVSHALCPYVQRAAIVLAEKGVAHERRDVDLSDKPGWFTAVSPLGKTPVLLVGEEPVFESAVICEYLDEMFEPRLHPEAALTRAQHRGWVEFASAVLNTIAGFYNAPDALALATRRAALRAQFERLEPALSARGPLFAGPAFSLVDAAWAPVFRYLDAFEAAGEAGWLEGLPRLQAWRAGLAQRGSVRSAVAADYPLRLRQFLAARPSELGRRIRV